MSEVSRQQVREFLQLKGIEPCQLTAGEPSTKDGYLQTHLVIGTTDTTTRIEALLLTPPQPFDAIVIGIHQHNTDWRLGKSEICGLGGDPLQAFGPALAKAGVAFLAADGIGFESRRKEVSAPVGLPVPPKARTQGTEADWLQYYNAAMHRLVRGELLMTHILDEVTLLVTAASQIAGTRRIGMVGHSYGGNVSLFAAAVDERIRFACLSGAVCSFAHKLRSGTGLEFALVIPSVTKAFDFEDLLMLLAPRRTMVVSADDDAYSADAASVVSSARRAFERRGAPDNLEHIHSGTGHALDSVRHRLICDWLIRSATQDEQRLV
jgi:dienelactone hydrolase